MSTRPLPRLPLGRRNFEVLRSSGAVYVDKTALICRLLSLGDFFFLARPRRFGKSLLISTLESLFRNGLKHFQGLAIENLWSDATYDVVRLDFSQVRTFKSIEEFRDKFDAYLVRRFADVGFEYRQDCNPVKDQLSDWMEKRTPLSLVLLIDEYDAPLTEKLDDAELFKSVRDHMSDFFLSLKENDGCIRFFFMTGITKISGTGIFSAFNSLYDLTLNPEFGTLLGYTEEEIERNFPEHLAAASKATGLTHGELMAELRRNYDGFSFDSEARTHVYSPWSVMMFLTSPGWGFRNYWYDSGGRPTVLLRYMLNHNLPAGELLTGNFEISSDLLSGAQEYDSMFPSALMVQTGYLTVKEKTAQGMLRVDYPNTEVARSMAKLIFEQMLGAENRTASNVRSLAALLTDGTDEAFFEALNRIFNRVNYDNYPVRDESSVRFGLQMLLVGGALMPLSEVHSALGRSDLEVNAGTRHWVFELKYAKNAAEVDRLLEEGVEQIRSRRYGIGADARELHRMALVFDGETRQFAAWRRAD